MIDLGRIESLIDQGYIKKRTRGDLAIYNYTAKTQYEGHWTPETMMCRGLILETGTGRVIARPFDKFFNWGERKKHGKGEIKTITEKLDGSMIQMFHHDGAWNFATRGAFDSEQAQWAEAYWLKWYGAETWDLFSQNYTYIFEAIYPENRVVVNYEQAEWLIMLAARNRETGEYVPRRSLDEFFDYYEDFDLVRTTTFDSITDIIEATGRIDANQEGWVVEMSDGSRWKFKGDQYVELHKLINGLTYKKAVIAVRDNKVEKYTEVIPDEFLDEWNAWLADINTTLVAVTELVEATFPRVPQGSRREFALWVNKEVPDYAPYLFAMLDNKDIRPMIFEIEFGVHQ